MPTYIFSLPPLCKGRWVGVSRAGGVAIHTRYKQSLTVLPKGVSSVQRNDTRVVPYIFHKCFVGNGLCAVPFPQIIIRRGRAQGSRPACQSRIVFAGGETPPLLCTPSAPVQTEPSMQRNDTKVVPYIFHKRFVGNGLCAVPFCKLMPSQSALLTALPRGEPRRGACRLPSQSPALTALPEGEPSGVTRYFGRSEL